jgi:hypothetical protein
MPTAARLLDHWPGNRLSSLTAGGAKASDVVGSRGLARCGLVKHADSADSIRDRIEEPNLAAGNRRLAIASDRRTSIGVPVQSPFLDFGRWHMGALISQVSQMQLGDRAEKFVDLIFT